MADAQAIDANALPGDQRTNVVPTTLQSQPPQSGASIFGGSQAPQPQSGAQIFSQAQPSNPQPSSAAQIFGSGPGSTGSIIQSQKAQQGMGDITPLQNAARGITSAVGRFMAPLQAPTHLMMGKLGADAATLGALGVPYMTELSYKLSPNGSVFPDTNFHDITDFMIDKASQAAGAGTLGNYVRSLAPVAKPIAGLVADVAADPLMAVSVLQPTKAAMELQKIGAVSDAASQAKNLVAIGDNGIPMTAVQPVIDAISKVKQAPGVGPVVDTIGKMARALSPETDNPAINLAMNTRDSLQRGGAAQLKTGYLSQMADKNFSEEEKQLMTALGEASSNIGNGLDPKILKSSAPGLFEDIGKVRQQISDQLPEIAKKMGITIADGRDEDIINGALAAKVSDARDLVNKVNAGVLDAGNINEKVLPNHMPHVMNPAYNGIKNAEELEEAFENPQLPGVGGFSTRDITRMRTMEGTVSDINQEILEKTGMKDFFITDPHVATALRELKSQKLLADSNFMDQIAPYGKRMTPYEAKQSGMFSIQHPELQGKTVVLKTPDGAVQTVKFNDLYFPSDTATKIAGRIGAPNVGNVAGSLGNLAQALSKSPIGNLNRISRATAFTSPGMFIRNGMDNFVKATARGAGMDALTHTINAAWGKSGSLETEGNLLSKTGKTYTYGELSQLWDKFGLSGSSSFSEGASNILDAVREQASKPGTSISDVLNGKKAADLAENIMSQVSKYGEKGELLSKKWLFTQKLMDGYTPEAAANEVTRYLFDYTRNSPATNFVRMFLPFEQHPIKTAGVAVDLIGGSPATYNFIHNTAPKVLANAFNDPVTQAAMKQLMPASLQMKDPIAGPIIPGNTWMAAALCNQKGQIGCIPYVTPGVGMSIMQHWDLTTKTARQVAQEGNFGLAPWASAAVNLFRGKDNFTGKPIPDDPVKQINYFLNKAILGSVIMPNTLKAIKQVAGIGDPNFYEPNTVLLMKALDGQQGGITNLDSDFSQKMFALAHLRRDLIQTAASELTTEKNNLSKQSSYESYIKENYSLIPATNQQIYMETLGSKVAGTQDIEGQEARVAASQQLLTGKLSAGDYISRIKNIDETIKQANMAYQLGAQRYLQISAGAKSSAEARARSGVTLFGR